MADSWANDNESWADDPTNWDTINLWHSAGVQAGMNSAIQATWKPTFSSGISLDFADDVQSLFLGNSVIGALLGTQMDWSRTQHVDSPFDFLVGAEAGILATWFGNISSSFFAQQSGFGRFPWDDDGPIDSTENWNEVSDGSPDQDWFSVPGDDGAENWTVV